jgi:hypothetical protein
MREQVHYSNGELLAHSRSCPVGGDGPIIPQITQYTKKTSRSRERREVKESAI